MVTTRRAFLWGSCALALLAKFGFVLNARAQTQVPDADLAQPSPLGDIVLGSPDAPVTIIEYASMTCPHCAQFQAKTFPKLKERYIDTGKVRYIFREFPLDPLAAGAFMLARCADKDKYMSIIDLFFGTQRDWVVPNPLQPLFNIAKQAGYNEETFNACLKNQQILDGIQNVRDHAAKVLNVESTPTFFINGKRVVGDVSIEEMEKEIKPFLKA
ncbi:MAG: DsbA family protein [Xanthobacteraceae bacterium]|nr:DsbA family protein [Xanthobacteraceae bacterium]MBV9235620.1 DsbA family protein [Xanthobacteraceae bacterium]